MALVSAWGFSGDSVIKHLAVMQEMWVRTLGQADPLEKGNGNLLQYSRLGNPWTEKPDRLQSMGSQESQP